MHRKRKRRKKKKREREKNEVEEEEEEMWEKGRHSKKIWIFHIKMHLPSFS